jgi:glyoxylase-like metal-dependent hydrolase (beta-lactamase superfamily II)
MARISPNLYAYVHPKGANCNVFLFKDGEDLDFIDSGIAIRPILSWLLKQIRADGLNPTNIRKIIHTHVHPDHIQADKFFQRQAKRNAGKVQILFPAADHPRFFPNYGIIHANEKVLEKVTHGNPIDLHPGWKIGMIALEKILLQYPKPNNLVPLSPNQHIQIGIFPGIVHTTGGHTAGHSIYEINAEEKILIGGDGGCINEFYSDFGKCVRHIEVGLSLKGERLLGGHDSLPNGPEGCEKDFRASLRRLDDLFRPILVELRAGRVINLSKISWRRVKMLGKIQMVEWWASMTHFCIARDLAKLGFGTLEIARTHHIGDILFHVSNSPHIKDRIEYFHNCWNDRSISPSMQLLREIEKCEGKK